MGFCLSLLGQVTKQQGAFCPEAVFMDLKTPHRELCRNDEPLAGLAHRGEVLLLSDDSLMFYVLMLYL